MHKQKHLFKTQSRKLSKIKRNFNRNKGFTLIEALVTVIVMSIGLLGVAALQNTSVKLSYDSYLRTQSALLSTDLFDRMRANLSVDYSQLSFDSSNTSLDCSEAAANCTALEMATYDAATWRGRVEEVFGADSGFTIDVTDTGSEGIDFTITFTWSARLSDPSSQNPNDNNTQTFSYQARVKNVPLSI